MSLAFVTFCPKCNTRRVADEPNPEGLACGGCGYKTLTYEQRQQYACKVCSNVPDEHGEIEHGKGCYTQDSDGGGSSFVDFDEDK